MNRPADSIAPAFPRGAASSRRRISLVRVGSTAGILSALTACGGPRHLTVLPRSEGANASVALIAAKSATDAREPASVPLVLADSGIAYAIVNRVADLRARGGSCRTYGDVLGASLATGRIVVRPYMWRVGSSLASASATASGELVFARDIDSLNVGVRTTHDVLWSVEHEAAHIAFGLTAGDVSSEVRADEHVRACQLASGQSSATSLPHP